MKKIFIILFLMSSFLFATIPSTPTLVLPANNATELAISSYTFKWNTSTGSPTSYHIQISMVSNFSYYTLRDSAVTDTFKVVTTLSANTKYFWRVRAKNGDGISAWSTVRSFTTITTLPIRPVLTAGNGTNEKFFRMGLNAGWIFWNDADSTYKYIKGTDTLGFGVDTLSNYTWYGQHTFKNVTTFDSTMKLADNQYFGSKSFVSGFGGSGWKLDYGLTEVAKSNLEFDNLVIRGRLSVYELLVRQIRATNGAIFVTASAKVSNVVGTTVTFYDPSYTGTTYMCPFAAGDLLQVQRFRPDGTTVIKLSKATVSSVSGADAVVVWNTGTFAIGDEVVRVGNTTDATRQNSIYLTSDDSNSPFIDMTTGVDSWTTWGLASKTKLRLGNLTGITDADFGGALSGYGLYAQNIYLKGNIVATAGKFGTTTNYWSIGATGLTAVSASTDVIINYGKTDFTNVQTGFILGYDFSASAAKFYMGSSTKYFNYDGTDFSLVGGTITGGTIQTATSGQRVVINSTGSSNDVKFYNSLGNLAGTITGSSVGGVDIVNVDTPILVATTLIKVPTINMAGSGNTFHSEASGRVAGATVSWSYTNDDISLWTHSGNQIPSTYYFRANSSGVTTSELSVGSSKFLVNSSGQITKINNITYAFPSVAPTLNQVLACSNATGGVLSWTTPISGSGTTSELAYWSNANTLGTLATATYPSLTEISYVKGLTSAAQTQINSKQATITGGATTIDTEDLTASKILVSDVSGKVAVSTIASSELFTPAYGELYDDVATSTITTNGSTYAKWTGTTVGECKGVTGSTANDNLTIDSGQGGKYKVNYSVTFTANTIDEYRWTINIGGTYQGKLRQGIKVGATSTLYTLSGTGIVSLSATNTIDLGCVSTNGNIVTVIYANLNIKKISN